jgi:hypothetical protein
MLVINRRVKIDPGTIILFHHFRRLLEAAAREGIEIAPLKGAHLLTSVYGPDEDRGPLADVDFLVRPEDWQRTLSLLARLGFRPRRRMDDRPVTGEEFYETGYILDINEDHRILFEPHRTLIQPQRHPIDYAALWDRTGESTFDGAPCRRLTHEDHFLYTVIHMTTHRFLSPAREVRDLELLVRNGGVDLELVVRRAGEWECRRSAWLALGLLDRRAPDLGLRRHRDSLGVPRHVRLALEALVPGETGFVCAAGGLRTQEALLWPWLMDGPGPLLRFGRYYVRLRLRDWLARFSRR